MRDQPRGEIFISERVTDVGRTIFNSNESTRLGRSSFLLLPVATMHEVGSTRCNIRHIAKLDAKILFYICTCNSYK